MRAVRAFVAHPRDPNGSGKRLRVTGRTKRELEARLQKLRALKEDKRLGLVTADEIDQNRRAIAGQRVTLRHACESYAKLERLAPATRRYGLALVTEQGPFRRGVRTRGPLADLANDRLEAITAPRIAKHFRALTERLAWGTVERVFASLTAVFRHAAEEGWIVSKPWGLWKPAKPTHPKRKARRECARNVRERDALLEAAFGIDGRLYAVVAVGIYTGARAGELAGLEWRDVTADGVRLERQGDGRPLKRGEARTVIAPELGPVFAAWRAELLGRGGRLTNHAPVFPTRAGAHCVGVDVIHPEHLRAAAARAGLGDPKRWSLHSLRDSFVTIEAQACGSDFRRLAERTGHRSIDALLRYLQAFERTPREPIASAPPALPPRPVE